MATTTLTDMPVTVPNTLRIIAIVAMLVLCLVIGLHMYRLIKTGLQFTRHTIRMQMAVVFGTLVAIVAIADVIPKEALTALLGTIIGIALGERDERPKT
jgi:uncharacterized membrane protein YdjX (TVP38/TMEM64 family)